MPRIARLFPLLLLITKFSLPLTAALPELSSIEPLEFDEAAQRLVARGDARLDFQDTRLNADRITYYQEYGLADALGNVSISRDGYRLIADRLSYDTQDSVFAVDILRTGQWPFYISSVNAGGTAEKTTFQGATFYYGNPGTFTPNVSSNQVDYTSEDGALAMASPTFRIGSVPIIKLPSYTYYTDQMPYLLEVDVGSDSDLGTYIQTTTLFPVNSWLRAGANLDLYTKRGVLAGPTAQYSYNTETQTINGAISTGYINDQGDPDPGLYNQPIDSDRGFVEWRHQQHIGERISLIASASYWSDSEVTRDFRDKYYNDNQQPDTFAEAVYAGDNYFLSTFGRFRPNDFQLVQERLPEVRFDLLPVPVFNTGAYQRFSASYVHLEEDFGYVTDDFDETSESDRFDFTYRIERPVLLTDWLTLTPLAGARITHYENQQMDPEALGRYNDPYSGNSTAVYLEDDQYTRSIYEVGFDLEARAYATYATQNKTWGIDGLRHQVRPVMRYRYFSDPDSNNEIAAIDREAFDLNRPLLDLSDLRNVDSIDEMHLTRLGVENLFQTRSEGYGSRTLAALNFYQDILFEKQQSYDGDKQDTFNATWVELMLTPAPWLRFELASRFKTEDLTLEELRSRTSIRSGEIWEIGLSTDFLNDNINQYRIDFIYRVNERHSFLLDTRYDSETGQFTKTEIGVNTRLSSAWELIYAVTFRQDASRESDVEFTIRLQLAGQ
ncbi:MULTISPECIES: LPS-assembly protein LptD [unclassified Lentimonas]|uniref:LPS-assembly protein LptD n=1 Tax=unclassified Lentimonas TaxID=2630993 RepID=UPI0013234ECB|nr:MULTISPECIES: LPS-assembly protein LptD [unclassified Lentimonas]CAA6693818.1 Organic solvent tolerance protein [Lentimonas sp. CC19]CAA6695120.1 Organic solvent tolerance protein [Lentimonas sp. CC10]CAA7069696.1 Organic solvent tolerance protein [Lentimonas sp. CC11]